MQEQKSKASTSTGQGKPRPRMKTPPKGLVVTKDDLITLLMFAIGAAGAVSGMKSLTTLKDRKRYLLTTAKTTLENVKRWKEILSVLKKGKVIQ